MKPEIFRESQLDELKLKLEGVDPKKIFLVGGGKSFKLSGSEAFINSLFKGQLELSFSGFDPNPQLDDLEKGLLIFNEGEFELIIAIGGGSVLDMAKLISIMPLQTESINDIAKGKIKANKSKIPLLAIPTTAGTGAETTAFSVLYMDKVKYSVASPSLLPDYVYLSPAFLISADSYLTACAGLDAFSQAIESLWSVNSTEESEGFALQAIKIIWEQLIPATSEKKIDSLAKMQEAAFLAGKAINITKTTAPHAISYAFTSYYQIPHGHAVCLSLAYFLKFNYKLDSGNCIDKRGVDHVKKRIDKIFEILKCPPDTIDEVLLSFYSKLGLETNIRQLIQDFNPQLILKNVNIERLANNPRTVELSDIQDLLN